MKQIYIYIKIIKDKISHRISFVIGWSKWHSLLVASCRSDLIDPLNNPSSSSTKLRQRSRSLMRQYGNNEVKVINTTSYSRNSQHRSSARQDNSHRRPLVHTTRQLNSIRLDDIQQQEEEEEDRDQTVTIATGITSDSKISSNTSPISPKATTTLPWIQIMRVETLWDRSTCEDSFRLLLKNLQLPPRTSQQVHLKRHI